MNSTGGWNCYYYYYRWGVCCQHFSAIIIVERDSVIHKSVENFLCDFTCYFLLLSASRFLWTIGPTIFLCGNIFSGAFERAFQSGRWPMFSDNPQAWIIPSPRTMNILKWPGTTFFYSFNLYFLYQFWIKMWNLNSEFNFTTQLLNLNLEFLF